MTYLNGKFGAISVGFLLVKKIENSCLLACLGLVVAAGPWLHQRTSHWCNLGFRPFQQSIITCFNNTYSFNCGCATSWETWIWLGVLITLSKLALLRLSFSRVTLCRYCFIMCPVSLIMFGLRRYFIVFHQSPDQSRSAIKLETCFLTPLRIKLQESDGLTGGSSGW